MKKPLIVLVVIILLLCWVFWSVNSELKTPNVISKNTALDDSRKNTATNNLLQQDEKPDSADVSTGVNLSNSNEDNQPSYLALYRDMRFLETCRIASEQVLTAENILTVKQSQLDRFEQTGLEINQPITAIQMIQYAAHLERCIQLIIKRRDSVYANITEQMLMTPAVTDKEKQLKALRALIQPWDDAWQNLFNVSKGITNAESLAIKAQLDEMGRNWRQQFQGVEFEFSEAERNTHYQTKKALEAQLAQLSAKDPKAKNQAWQQVQQLTQNIKQYMLLGDFDLFFEAAALLNDDRQLRFLNGTVHARNFKQENLEQLAIPYQKVAEEVMLLTGPMDRINFLAIAPFANQLYLCTLGQECGPDSTLMNHYCFNAEYPTACEKDLMAFFVDDFLSPNQLQDVMSLYEQLVIIYAP